MTWLRMRQPTWLCKLCYIMSNFFLPKKGAPGTTKGRKVKADKKKSEDKSAKKPRFQLNEEIASDSDGENESGTKRHWSGFGKDSGSEDENETAPQKRLRLAKEYLVALEKREQDNKEVDGIHQSSVAHRLREDVLEQAGKLQRKVADKCVAPDPKDIRILKGHQLSVTCVAVTPDDKSAYTGSKDCCIIKWDMESGRREVIFSGHRKGVEGGVIGHTGHVFALAISSDGKFLASGGQDKVVHIWNAQTNLHLHTFRGHKGSVMGLAFQSGSRVLFSCSLDRTVKIWNLDEMAYVETLFGHQDGVSSIHCLHRERPVTAGTNDHTLRLWKILEESQLVFNGHKSSIDSVRLINEDHMISGSQDGTVALWNILKKKPLVTQRHHPPPPQGNSLAPDHWVASVAAYPNTDLVASGSNDGVVRLWKCGDHFRSLEPIFSVPLKGFVNDLVFTHDGDYLLACMGQEHRCGRWWKERNSKNCLAIIPLKNLL